MRFIHLPGRFVPAAGRTRAGDHLDGADGCRRAVGAFAGSVRRAGRARLAITPRCPSRRGSPHHAVRPVLAPSRRFVSAPAVVSPSHLPRGDDGHRLVPVSAALLCRFDRKTNPGNPVRASTRPMTRTLDADCRLFDWPRRCSLTNLQRQPCRRYGPGRVWRTPNTDERAEVGDAGDNPSLGTTCPFVACTTRLHAGAEAQLLELFAADRVPVCPVGAKMPRSVGSPLGDHPRSGNDPWICRIRYCCSRPARDHTRWPGLLDHVEVFRVHRRGNRVAVSFRGYCPTRLLERLRPIRWHVQEAVGADENRPFARLR